MGHQIKTAIAGAQILFVAFGAMVLVPLLTGLNPALALLGAGIGTLLFQAATKRKVPIFLGSSFAFIAPIIYSIQEWGLPATLLWSVCRRFHVFFIRLAGEVARTGSRASPVAARGHRTRDYGHWLVCGCGGKQYGNGQSGRHPSR